jgi:hypothetical protein
MSTYNYDANESGQNFSKDKPEAVRKYRSNTSIDEEEEEEENN